MGTISNQGFLKEKSLASFAKKMGGGGETPAPTVPTALHYAIVLHGWLLWLSRSVESHVLPE